MPEIRFGTWNYSGDVERLRPQSNRARRKWNRRNCRRAKPTCANWTAQRHRAGGRTPARHAQEAKQGEKFACGEDYCSKIKTAGLGSFSESTTNLDGETTYRTPVPPILPLVVPRPSVGAAEME